MTDDAFNELFDKFDEDKNGTIERHEVADFLNRVFKLYMPDYSVAIERADED